MPAMPIESVSPPEELEDNWPLQAHGDALELPDAAGAKKKTFAVLGSHKFETSWVEAVRFNSWSESHDLHNP